MNLLKEQGIAVGKFLKEVYERYVYLIAKPFAILLVLVLLFKLLHFVSDNVILFISGFVKLTLPFLIGIGLSFLLEPANRFLTNKCKFPRVLAVSVTLFGTLSIVLGSIGLILYIAIIQLTNFSKDSFLFFKEKGNSYWADLAHQLMDNKYVAFVLTEKKIDTYTAYIQDNLETIVKKAMVFLSEAGTTLAGVMGGFFTAFLPAFSMITIIAIITSFFISKDKELMLEWFERLTPKSIHDAIFKIKTEAVKNLFKYMKGQLILVSISAVIFLIAFFIIRSPYAFALALLTLVLDLIPVIGTFILVIPWAVYAFATGDHFTAYALIGAYAISTIVRQVIEPKIMADSLGFHPLLLLVSLYFGIQIFGGMGVIIGPMLLVLIKILFDTRILKWQRFED